MVSAWPAGKQPVQGLIAEDAGMQLRLTADPHLLDPAAWNALLDAGTAPTPFMRHEFLAALHRSGSATAHTGWTPAFLTLHAAQRLEAACPVYLKSHSFGEYVFDWSWADAYARHGLNYYPKLLVAVPFTPVPGTRLLARDAGGRRALLQALRGLAGQSGLSSVHLLFCDATEARDAASAGWHLREAVQFHWHNRQPEPYTDFQQFLGCFQHDKRKKIGQERRRVAHAGVRFRVLEAEAIDRSAWDFFHRCYTLTYQAHRSTPYLTRTFFEGVAASMPRNWVMFIAERQGRQIAASLVAVDPLRRTAYGRYWGCTEYVPRLHFEACYYQPLNWCIEHGYLRLEGGAQGEHKMARGLLPVRTCSAHWLSEPAFAEAVGNFLRREGAGIEQYVDELRERSPFRSGNAPDADAATG